MTARLKTAIQKHLQQFRFTEHGSPWVFHHLANRRRGATKAGDRVKNFRVRLKKSAVEAKLPEGFQLHDLRHRRVTTWLADGKNPVHVKEALGHADLRTTMGYTHLAREHLRILVKSPDARPGMGSTG